MPSEGVAVDEVARREEVCAAMVKAPSVVSRQDMCVGEVDEEFVCGVCADVLRDPVMPAIIECTHTYCRGCIYHR